MTGIAASENAWLLPSALTAAPDRAGRQPRRTTRDWIVDSLCFLIAAGFAIMVSWDLHQRDQPGPLGGTIPEWVLTLDGWLSVALCGVLWVRRRWPVQLALAGLPLSLISPPSGMLILIVLFTVVVHRPLKIAAPVTGLHLLAALIFCWLRPDPTVDVRFAIALTLAIMVSVTLWAMVVRARRQLVVSLRDRAHRAEAEQQLRVAQARHLERTRIAREMHDVLAHRISLLSLHAGALEFRPDAAPDEVARAAGVIRDNAHLALQDLREVIGVLREESTGEGPERPQPTLADLAVLAEESRRAGMRVSVRERIERPEAVPAGIGRNAYRIVQEGLTNARKHALGSAVTVTVVGGPGTGLSVEVSNRWPVGQVPAQRIPGTGTGLVGLAERTSLAGGRLEHGRTATGDFRLAAWLPWSA
ncbi:sensor histidine kinase [Micromonospora sp. NBC_01796]|uniref:sensor histidine kinase n=1 Tax=Micromonospora sp. NBC_01796 TaxID=2975987 RepID=UPI002DD8FC2C|nr:histidine kinase [Micromonospora sp. NBC_01796]WSA87381.1 histidine kinase [Micromonospora sp. NBC_01796]